MALKPDGLKRLYVFTLLKKSNKIKCTICPLIKVKVGRSCQWRVKDGIREVLSESPDITKRSRGWQMMEADELAIRVGFGWSTTASNTIVRNKVEKKIILLSTLPCFLFNVCFIPFFYLIISSLIYFICFLFSYYVFYIFFWFSLFICINWYWFHSFLLLIF